METKDMPWILCETDVDKKGSKLYSFNMANVTSMSFEGSNNRESHINISHGTIKVTGPVFLTNDPMIPIQWCSNMITDVEEFVNLGIIVEVIPPEFA